MCTAFSLKTKLLVQIALVIYGLGIRSFDYPRVRKSTFVFFVSRFQMNFSGPLEHLHSGSPFHCNLDNLTLPTNLSPNRCLGPLP